ncbi:hypothetical protein, partial [Pseudomonas aeruginosa]|uniref:hypothetical protein n=1 Tax=Pseudomonas aeruginosa TaxID=287 RepID=UPI0028876EA3
NAFNKKKADILYCNYFDVFPAFKLPDIIHNFSKALNGETVTLDLAGNNYLKGHHTMSFSPIKDTGENIIGVLQVIIDKTKETDLQHNL